MSDYQVKVSTEIPNAQFKHLYQVAEKRGTTVGALVAQMVSQALIAPEQKPKRRPQARYTAEIGARLLKMRRLHRSNQEMAAEFRIGPSTVGQWMRLAEHDERTNQMNKQEEAK